MKYMVYILSIMWVILQVENIAMTDSMIGTRQMVAVSNLPRGALSCIRHRRRLRSRCSKGNQFDTADDLTVTVAVVPVSVVALTQ
jgi:hypothetical protein